MRQWRRNVDFVPEYAINRNISTDTNGLILKPVPIGARRARNISYEGIADISNDGESWAKSSDTLKRHQKLHVADGAKSSKRGGKTTKTHRVDMNSDVVQSDRSTEASVDQSPTHEVSEPQFSYDTLEAWENCSYDPVFASNMFSYMEIENVGHGFDDVYIPVEESSVGSIGGKFTVNPDLFWEPV